jgi:hypothetical protein
MTFFCRWECALAVGIVVGSGVSGLAAAQVPRIPTQVGLAALSGST